MVSRKARSAFTSKGSRRYGAVGWVVERDFPGQPGVVEFASFGSRKEAGTIGLARVQNRQ